MAAKFADRVEQSTFSRGRTSFTLVGAPTGKRSFADAFGIGDNEIAVTIEDAVGPNWIVALATLSASNLLTIDTILASSNEGAAVSFNASRKNVYSSVPAQVLNALVAGNVGGGSGVPVNSIAPAITGTTTVGSTLSASTGTWSNTPTSYAYQWKRGGAAISGATASTYALVSGDLGATITVSVIATNGSGASATVTSAGVGPVTSGGTGTPDTKPRFAIGTAAASLASLFAAAADMPGSANGTRVGGPFTVSPPASQYGYVFVLQSACATGGGIPSGSFGVTFMDSLGSGGWQGAGLSGNNTGASPSQSYSAVTYTDATGVYVVFRQDYANAAFTGSIT